jgi:hypothetical protein
MSASILPQSSLFIGIIPALIILYFGLKRFEGYFLEKTMFIMFVIGIIAGFLTVVLEGRTELPNDLFSIVLFVIIFSFLEQIIKTAVLNLKRYHEKPSTIFYGFSLGLGFGSIYPLFLMLSLSSELEINVYITILIGSIGLIILHGLTGLLIGYGIYKGRLIQYYIYGVLILIGANLLMKIQYIQLSVFVIGIIFYFVIKRTYLDTLSNQLEKRKRSNQSPVQ